MADIVRGTLLVVFIVALAGAIAYVGDRVGHQVGRKRLSLFGIRPRYTSTIVAIGTGMTIALIVTLGALIASNSVKTAFFHLTALNARVTQLQDEQDQLNKQTRQQSVIVGVGALMNTTWIVIAPNASVPQRYQQIKAFYDNTITHINRTFLPLGLRKNSKPEAEVIKNLHDFAEDYRLTALLSQSPVVLVATADQNMFRNDEVHFQFRPYPDIMVFPKGAIIASIFVQASPKANLRLELSRLGDRVVEESVKNGMPLAFAAYAPLDVSVADGNAMQARLQSGAGTYLLEAVARENVFPDMGVVPAAVVLKKP